MYFTGIDISKEKLDLEVIGQLREPLHSEQCKNNTRVIKRSLRALMKKLKCAPNELIICCENTGIYGDPLIKACASAGVTLWVENAHKIKKASYDLRGKSDQMDASRIADYCLRYIDRLVPYKAPSEAAIKLRELKGIREDLMDEKHRLMNTLRESKSHSPEKYRLQKTYFQPVLNSIKKQLQKVEKQIQEAINENPEIAKNIELLCSIPGVGLQNALMFVVVTDNFTRFESAKHLACYAGVAPFPNQSGKSTKRNRVSKHANHKLKKLIHMAAMVMKRWDPEIQEYYNQKRAQGKHHTCVINAIRNKIIHRMWAVVKRQTPYVKKQTTQVQIA